MADLLAFDCDVSLLSCHFPICILDQMLCLIVLIPNLCHVSYLHLSIFKDIFSTKIYDKRAILILKLSISHF